MEIFHAARAGDLDKIRRLIETEGVPIDGVTKAGNTALGVAASYG
jgi:hypothetical protein